MVRHAQVIACGGGCSDGGGGGGDVSTFTGVNPTTSHTVAEQPGDARQ